MQHKAAPPRSRCSSRSRVRLPRSIATTLRASRRASSLPPGRDRLLSRDRVGRSVLLDVTREDRRDVARDRDLGPGLAGKERSRHCTAKVPPGCTESAAQRGRPGERPARVAAAAGFLYAVDLTSVYPQAMQLDSPDPPRRRSLPCSCAGSDLPSRPASPPAAPRTRARPRLPPPMGP